jgi:hypothetical protein
MLGVMGVANTRDGCCHMLPTCVFRMLWVMVAGDGPPHASSFNPKSPDPIESKVPIQSDKSQQRLKLGIGTLDWIGRHREMRLHITH